ncbi:Gfo/Idh/MocA family oxidoreductase [Streptomyces sp. NPDC046821]|uniref:Gfo/Idh/MocA family protein n=1 Tax=Streptomyces sp. NPDC046821 TaxID=3154702 RepID=UPI0033C3F92E
MPADPTVRVAVLGTGFGLSHHAQAWGDAAAARVVAICSARPGRGQEAARFLHGVEGFDDWRRMLDEARPDVLVIASRPDAHAEPAIAALGRGIHVLCEKPLTGDLEDALRVRKAADESTALFAMDFEFRFSEIRQAVRHEIAGGGLGDVRSLVWTVRYPSYERLAAQPHGWLWEESHGGGIARAIGSHLLDSLFWFAPFAWETGGTRWSSIAERAGTPSAADDAFTVTGRAPGGAGFAVTLTPTHGAFASELTVVGTRATLVMDEARGIARVHRGPDDVRTVHQGLPSGPGTPGDDLRPRLARLVDRFLDGVRGRPCEDLPGIENGIKVQEALETVTYLHPTHDTGTPPLPYGTAMKSETT